MPLLNYTTKVDMHKTVGEIQCILARAGAKTISIDYVSSVPVAVTFFVSVDGNWINFRLPINHVGVLALLEEDPIVPRALKNDEQAQRVSWRIIKDWIEAQMALIASRQAELAEVFLPYAVTGNGQTLFQKMKSEQFLLEAGGK